MRQICVLCGANTGKDPKYLALARQAAHLFHSQGWALVYGGSAQGLMGAMAGELALLGGHVHGIKPEPFLKYEPTKQLPEFGEQELVPSLYAQKVRMRDVADAFLFLPGGFGTLEEFCTFRMWAKLGIHTAPIIVLDYDDFFRPLVEWIEGAVSAGFVSNESVNAFQVISRLDELQSALLTHSFTSSERFQLDVVAGEGDEAEVEQVNRLRHCHS